MTCRYLRWRDIQKSLPIRFRPEAARATGGQIKMPWEPLFVDRFGHVWRVIWGSEVYSGSWWNKVRQLDRPCLGGLFRGGVPPCTVRTGPPVFQKYLTSLGAPLGLPPPPEKSHHAIWSPIPKKSYRIPKWGRPKYPHVRCAYSLSSVSRAGIVSL